MWGECSARHFEWFEGDPVTELLFKVHLSNEFITPHALACVFWLLLWCVENENICLILEQFSMLLQVKELYGLENEVTFRNVTVPYENRPRPLYLGTATQIG